LPLTNVELMASHSHLDQRASRPVGGVTTVLGSKACSLSRFPLAATARRRPPSHSPH